MQKISKDIQNIHSELQEYKYELQQLSLMIIKASDNVEMNSEDMGDAIDIIESLSTKSKEIQEKLKNEDLLKAPRNMKSKLSMIKKLFQRLLGEFQLQQEKMKVIQEKQCESIKSTLLSTYQQEGIDRSGTLGNVNDLQHEQKQINAQTYDDMITSKQMEIEQLDRGILETKSIYRQSVKMQQQEQKENEDISDEEDENIQTDNYEQNIDQIQKTNSEMAINVDFSQVNFTTESKIQKKSQGIEQKAKYFLCVLLIIILIVSVIVGYVLFTNQ